MPIRWKARPPWCFLVNNIKVAVSGPGVCCYSGVTAHRIGGRGVNALPVVVSVIKCVKVIQYV